MITQKLIFPDFIWNPVDFTYFMKSDGFHVKFCQISHKIQQISWNPPANLINQIIQEKLFSVMECSGKAMSHDFMKSGRFHEICQILWNQPDFMWNLPDFERPIARNGKTYVKVSFWKMTIIFEVSVNWNLDGCPWIFIVSIVQPLCSHEQLQYKIQQCMCKKHKFPPVHRWCGAT